MWHGIVRVGLLIMLVLVSVIFGFSPQGPAQASGAHVVATAPIATNLPAEPTSPPQATATPSVSKLTQAEAERRLRDAGITWSSSGNCSDRNNSRCTSFEQINARTIESIIAFKELSGCDIVITGGTETGHASGTYSHWNGYKVDIRKNPCVNDYIKNNFIDIGGGKWRSPAGNIYYDEGDHWDITYY